MPIKSKYTKINKKGKEKEISKKKYTKLQEKYSTKTGSDMKSSGGSSYTTAGPRGKKVKVTMLNSAGNAKKGKITKRRTVTTGTGTREVDGKEYDVAYKDKTVYRKDGTVRKTVSKEKGLPVGPINKKSPIKKSRTVKRYRSVKDTEPKSAREASMIEQFKKEDQQMMEVRKKGGTLGYEPTAKYGKAVKPSMFMSGGELKKYKKRKK